MAGSELEGRVGLFIDGWNLYNSARDLGIPIDYSLLKDRLVADRRLRQATYFGSQREEPTERELQLHEEVRKAGFEVRLRRLFKKHWTREIPRGVVFSYEVSPDANEDDLYTYSEKGVDVAIATEMLTQAWDDRYDVAILGSGDGDYAVTVEALTQHGKEVEVASFTRPGADGYSSLSRDLTSRATRVIDLEELLR